MAIPNFNGFDLQDDTYITESVQADIRAKRNIEIAPLPRRIGGKFLNQEIGQKTIQISGVIVTDTEAELRQAKDDLFRYVSSIEGALEVYDGRTYTATAERIDIKEQQYSKTVQPFEIQFVCAKPYAEGVLQNPVFIVASGLFQFILQTTISGTMANRPTFTLTLPSGTGTSPVNIVKVRNLATANEVTVSGSFAAASQIVFNYDRYVITNGGTTLDYVGQMDDIEPGSNTFTIVVSGTKNDGTRVGLQYNPRYW